MMVSGVDIRQMFRFFRLEVLEIRTRKFRLYSYAGYREGISSVSGLLFDAKSTFSSAGSAPEYKERKALPV